MRPAMGGSAYTAIREQKMDSSCLIDNIKAEIDYT